MARPTNTHADEFAERVSDALTHLYDPIHLEGHPLTSSAPGSGDGSRTGRAGPRLRQWLLDAIAALEPARGASAAAAGWRGYQLLNLRYVEALSAEAVQTQLGISRAQFYREHRRAVDAVVSILSQQRVDAAARGDLAAAMRLSALGDRTAPPAPGSGGALPSGTVTFLFTDLEGSTKLLEAHPAAYRTAVRRHHDLLGQAVVRHGGLVFETVGDAVYAAFGQATDAVAAAVDGQLALHREAWGEVGRLRARMGVHTGEAELQDGHYFGVPLYRGGRLMAAAYGGQTVVSEATTTLVKDALPEGVMLRDLGLHRLRDMPLPERVYQLVHPELESEFPPLRTLDALTHNLPAQSTPFLGREREVTAVRARLREPHVRLLTLLGPGGTGKTRLALQAAAEAVEDFPQGVFFISLAGIGDPALVASTIGQAVGVPETGGRSALAALTHHLRHRMALVVLDNCEHVVEGCVVAAELLAACPHVKILATSRVALRLAGEHEVHVSPLTVPLPTEWGAGHELGRAERLSQYEAVRLFLNRAQAAQAEFEITEENAPAVAEICYRLDGLPLAVELAAARVKLLSPHALLARLGHRLALLTSGPRDLPARHQTLRAAIGWSYDLLTEPERVLFRRLGVFAGGWDLAAVEAVCGTPEAEIDALDGISSLIDKNLVRRADDAGGVHRGEPRFVMLETIREFAREWLALSGEEEALRRRHAGYYESLLEAAHEPLRGRRAPFFVWLDRLTQEHDNLRAMLRWLIDRGEAARALSVSPVMFLLWQHHGYFAEGRRWLEELLALPGAATRTERRAQALNNLAILRSRQGDLRESLVLAEESIAISKEVGELGSAARKLQYAGYRYMWLGDTATARLRSQESADISRQCGSTHELAYRLQDLVLFALEDGDFAEAQRRGEESRDAFAALERGDYGWAMAQSRLGMVAQRRGEYARARILFQESLARFRTLESPLGIAGALAQLGGVALNAGDLDEARAMWSEEMGHHRSAGAPLEIADLFERFAMLAAAEADGDRALRLVGAAEAIRDTLGAPREPGRTARLDTKLAGAMASPSARAAREAGRELSVEAAIALSLSAPVLLPPEGARVPTAAV